VKKITDRILEARLVCLNAGRIPNRLKLPTLEAAQFNDWLQTIENDPFLGYTPIGKQLFGMIFEEDPTATEIVAYYVEEKP